MTERPNSLAARDIAHHFHPYTNLKAHETTGPFIVTHGKGIHVYDEDGREYIEALAGLWCTALGFSEPRLAEAAARQMNELPMYHAFAHKAHPRVIELAERLAAMAPIDVDKVFFANSGSEANDTAIKLVWYYNNALGRPAKKKIISRKRAYHGVTVMAGSLTGLAPMQNGFDLPREGVIWTETPHFYRGALDGESEDDFATRMATELDRLIEAENPDTVAAMFAEPVMGAGGVIVPPETYFPKIKAVLDKHDVLLIADEVICGFGRTGEMFGSQTFGIEPDMMTVAKGLSSGYIPISAVMMSEKVFGPIREQSDALGLFGHGFTYSGHPVSAAVALETLKIFEERDILGHVQAVAPRFQSHLKSFADHPLVGETRGVGLIGAVDCVADKESRAPFDPAAKVGPTLMKLAQDHGLISRAMGDALAFSPPLIIDEREIDTMFDRFAHALDALHGWAGEQGLV